MPGCIANCELGLKIVIIHIHICILCIGRFHWSKSLPNLLLTCSELIEVFPAAAGNFCSSKLLVVYDLSDMI